MHDTDVPVYCSCLKISFVLPIHHPILPCALPKWFILNPQGEFKWEKPIHFPPGNRC